MMIIVLPLSLAGLLIVIVCLKFRLTYKSKADTSMEVTADLIICLQSYISFQLDQFEIT